MDERMKARGQTTEWNSESRVRENRPHGLMRVGVESGRSFVLPFALASRLLYWRFPASREIDAL